MSVRGKKMHKKERRRRRLKRTNSSGSDDGSAALLIVIGFLVWFFFIRSDVPVISADYSSQAKALAQTEVTLKNLASFVSDQRLTLQEQEKFVAQLGEEADDLRLFLETEGPKVQAILDAQARKYRADRWWQLAASFVLGIVASLVARFLSRRFIGITRPVDESSAAA